MCVAVLMAMAKFSGVEIKLMVMQTIKVGLVEVNISIIMTLMNSGRQQARGIVSKLTYRGIVSSFATKKQHEELNNGRRPFIQTH